MMPKYTTYKGLTGQQFVLRENEDGSITSFLQDPANPDYQTYLAWLEDPNAEITPPVL
jgi:hypothetical protein